MKRAAELVLAIVLCCSLISCGSKVKSPQDFYDLGVRYLSEGNYEDAVLAFNTLLQIEPNHVDGLFGRGQALQELGGEENIESAQADYRAALDLDQSNEQIWFALTDLLMENGDESEAKDLLAQFYEKFGASEDYNQRITKLKENGALDGDDLSHFGLTVDHITDFESAVLSQEETEEITNLLHMHYADTMYQSVDIMNYDCTQADAEQRAINFCLIPRFNLYSEYYPWSELHYSYNDEPVEKDLITIAPVYTDPLRQIPLGYLPEGGETEYVVAPGDHVDWILRNILNLEPSHPSSAVEINNTEFGSMLYYYYDGKYYCEQPYGLGSEGPGNKYTLSDIKQYGDFLYLRCNISLGDESIIDSEVYDVNWEESRWVLLKKNTTDERSVWSLCYIGGEPLDDISQYIQ